jgi:hypothetical protein
MVTNQYLTWTGFAELYIDPFHDLGGACFGNADCFDDFLTHIDS